VVLTLTVPLGALASCPRHPATDAAPGSTSSATSAAVRPAAIRLDAKARPRFARALVPQAPCAAEHRPPGGHEAGGHAEDECSRCCEPAPRYFETLSEARAAGGELANAPLLRAGATDEDAGAQRVIAVVRRDDSRREGAAATREGAAR
jgi:hypothetical protein